MRLYAALTEHSTADCIAINSL